ncbi:MAG: pyridoxal 5'-phosphate synthase glutaminase subunit PdxT [Ilumatobacteraceae bacterium]|jgi:5'-phosphate synthase pdxT subunit|nr:pyridoxal 5'-phosphate synthase glutaminase subunit PdxT [Ilumatobacteraceae bacterium]
MQIGVLALQGAFAAHSDCLASIGVQSVEVRTPEQLNSVDALLMPGGESSTMSQLLESSGLFDPISLRIADGMPVFGTCAGMILLASEILDGRSDQRSFSAIDISVRRNAFGRQVDSFESTINSPVGEFHGVFIRAPRIERVGDGVEVLGSINNEPVLVRQGNVLAASFHPELSNDARLHEYFVSITANRKKV